MSSTQNSNAKFNRAFISKKDFEEANEYLCLYEPYAFDVGNKALLMSAIVSYSRPFTKNDCGKGGMSTPMLMNKPNKILDSKELELHCKIIRLRNEAIAHSAYTKKAVRVTSADHSGYGTSSRIFDIFSEGIEKNHFMSVIAKMIRYCDETMSYLKHFVQV